MKNYTITVNGNVYDVTVEETGAAPVAAPKTRLARTNTRLEPHFAFNFNIVTTPIDSLAWTVWVGTQTRPSLHGLT